jgi:hypothetical protein
MPSIDPLGEPRPASAITQTTATLNATLNPAGGTISGCTFEYGTTLAYGTSVPCTPSTASGSSPVEVSASVADLTPRTIYHFRVQTSGGFSSADEAFKTLPDPPTVITKAASLVTQTTATLNASVNPNGGEVSKCEFEYGETTSYGKTAPCTSAPGSGTAAVPVSASVTGLTENTTYQYKVVATNAGGTSEGEGSFKTPLSPPTAVTGAASGLTQTTATLHAAVNPNDVEVTECMFEYGTTTSYGETVSCTSAPGSGGTAVAVSAPLAGLAANTTYHFRVVAVNAGGRVGGSDETFATLATVSPPPTTVELAKSPVSPPAKTPAGLPAPVLGHSANMAAVVGRVSVRPPGARTFASLSSTAKQISYGTIVEATHGEVSITAATAAGGVQTGVFFDGQFMLTQGSNGTVRATLTGGDFSVCPMRTRGKSGGRARKGARYAAPTHLVRRLWGNVGGSFSTRADYAEGLVQGAEWLTEDMCEGTLILATRNQVEVTDLVRHRHVEVGTEQIYIANRSPTARAILNR